MDDAERLIFLAWSKRSQFRAKVEQSISIIKEALAIAPAYVACSWGKDSLVVAHLVWRVNPGVLLFHDGSEDEDEQDNYDEVKQSFLSRFDMPYKGIVRGYNAGDGGGLYEQLPSETMVFLGLRAEESRERKIALFKYGQIHQYCSGSPVHPVGSWRCCPIAWWGWKDVWAYIVQENMKYLTAYDHWTVGSRGRTAVIHGKKWNGTKHRSSPGAEARLRLRNPEFWGKMDHA